MANKCQAKNPATCKNHGVPLTSSNPANDEAAKKEFFGEKAYEKVTAAQNQADRATMITVTKWYKRSVRDIEGFTGYVTGIGKRRVAEIVNDPNLSAGAGQKDGDSTAVKEVRKYFRENHDSTSNGGPSALATVRLFKALGRARELGDSIREEALLQAQRPSVTAGFEARAEAIVSIFRKHGFFGDVSHNELDRTGRNFIEEVSDHARGKHGRKPAEFMYRPSATQVIVRASMDDERISIDQIRIVQEPYPSFSYDGDKFAEDLAHIYNSDSYTKELRTYPRNQ